MLKKTVVIILTLMISFMLFIMPVSAATETMTFNLWSLYDNSFTFGFASSVSNGDIFDCPNTDNSVSVDSKSITKIKNTTSYFSYCDINYIHSFYLRTHDFFMKPTFFLSEKFLNQPIKFTVTHKATLTTAKFSGSYNFNPSFEFYVGTKDNYNIVSCDLVYSFLLDSDFSSYYYYTYDFVVTFKEVGTICGFNFNLESDSDIGVRLDNITGQPTLFCECTLSPLVFDVGITAEDIGDAVGEAIKEQHENEKQEVTDSGNDAVDSVTGAIPSDTTGFMEAVKLLTSSMSYDGTDAVWTIPSMKIPEMEGITAEIKLTDDLQVNFADYVNMIPSKVLSVARIVCTLALIVFCVKELYGLIQEIMISRRSGTNE